MIFRLSFCVPFCVLLLAASTTASAATPRCHFEPLPVGPQKLGDWIDKHNWLALENQRLGLLSAQVFMPSVQMMPAPERAPKSLPARHRQIDEFPVIDPLDGKTRNLGFLLDSRFYADGFIVLQNGHIIAERYRNGLTPDSPRLLMEASRPWLNVLAAISINQGKLAADKSLSRYLPVAMGSTGLRKISVQRLLENKERMTWPDDELDSWQQASGWQATPETGSLRDWLAQPGRWDKPMQALEAQKPTASPEDDLLAWILASSHATPLAELFCQHLLSNRSLLEHPIFWLTDGHGVELATSLGMSLRDFAKLGQLLIEARSSRYRGKVPSWFIETLTASTGLRHAEISGLAQGSEARYGFIHLGGPPNRVALMGRHGTSLFINFDKRLVIATYATRPGANTPGALAVMEQVWKTATQASGDQKKP